VIDGVTMFAKVLSDESLARLEKQDKDLGLQLKKWRPKIHTLALDLSKVTGESYEDSVQILVQKAWVDVKAYRMNQVRFNKQLWEVLSEDEGGLLHLKRQEKFLTLHKNSVEEIKKSSLGTYIYSGLRQLYLDYCSHQFTRTNGYQISEAEPTVSKRVFDKGTKEIVTKTYPNFQKVYGTSPARVVSSEGGLELDEIDSAEGVLDTPEDEVIFDDLVERLMSQLSDDAQGLLKFFLQQNADFLVGVALDILRQQQDHPGTNIRSIKADQPTASKFFSKSRAEIQRLWLEIVESLPSSFLSHTSVVQSPKGGYKRVSLVQSALSALLQ
jgi:hypothetical protein